MLIPSQSIIHLLYIPCQNYLSIFNLYLTWIPDEKQKHGRGKNGKVDLLMFACSLMLSACGRILWE